MTEQELQAMEQQKDLQDRLSHPDPDPSELPVVIPEELVQAENTVMHILRSSLTLDTWIEQQKRRMEADMEAWTFNIATLEAKRKAWREMVKAWMERNGVTKLQCPWFTASLGKPRSKKVVQNEEAVIDLAKRIYPAAVKVKYQLIKSEVDVMADTFPRECDGIITEETGESTLIVRRKQ